MRSACAYQIADLGFNCVRLTYAVETVQRRAQPAAEAVKKQLSPSALAGLEAHNAWVLNASVWDVFHATVSQWLLVSVPGCLLTVSAHFPRARGACRMVMRALAWSNCSPGWRMQVT